MQTPRLLSLLSLSAFLVLQQFVPHAVAQTPPHHNSTAPSPVGMVAHHGFYKYEGAEANAPSAMLTAVDHNFFATHFCVRFTSDLTPILLHDPTLGGLNVSDATCAQLTSLSLEQPPTLLKNFLSQASQAILQQSAHHLPSFLFLQLNLTPQSPRADQAVAQVLELAKHTQVFNSLYLLPSNIEACRAAAASLKSSHVACLGGDLPPDEVSSQGIGCIFYPFHTLQQHPSWTAEAHSLGMQVGNVNVNEAPLAHELIQLGIDFLSTDRPLDMTQWIDNYTNNK